MNTLEIINSGITDNEYSGQYLVKEVKTGRVKRYDAREKAAAIAKAIDEPQLGFTVELLPATWEDYRIAGLMEDGLTREEAEQDFYVQQQRKVDALAPKSEQTDVE